MKRLRFLGFSAPRIEESPRLRLLGLASLWLSALGITYVGGDLRLSAAAIVLGTLGHWVSWRWRRQQSMLRPLLIAAVVIALSVGMRSQMMDAIHGDWLPLGYFLLLVHAVSSFDLRTRAGLYTGLVLSGTALFLASQQAFEPGFGVCIVGFLVLLLAFLTLAFLEDGVRDAQVHWVRRRGRMVGYWIGTACAVFVLSGLAFWVMPRGEDDLIGPPRVAILPYSSSSLEGAAAVPIINPANIPPVAPEGETPSDTSPGAAGTGRTQNGSPDGRATAQGGLVALPDGAGRTPGGGRVIGWGAGNEGAAQGSAGFSLDQLGQDPDSDIVLFVRSRVASYWRGQTLESFDGRQWGTRLAGPYTDDRGHIPHYLERAAGRANTWYNRESYGLDNQIGYHQTFAVQRDQPNMVFMGYRGLRIVADEGALEGFGVKQGDSYRVLSVYPRYRPTRLKEERSTGAGHLFTSLPPGSERLGRLALEITRDANSDFEKAERIVVYLAQQGNFDPRQPGDLNSSSALDEFLFEGKAGSVLDYATATVLLARASGLSARLALGYLPGIRDPLSGAYTVRDRDAHTWAEIYFTNYGWVPFDSAPRASAIFRNGSDSGLARFLLSGSGERAYQAARAAPSELAEAFMNALKNPLLLRLGPVLAAAGLVMFLALRWLQRKSAKRQRPGVRLGLGYTRLSGKGRREVLKLYSQVEKLLRSAVGARRMPCQTVGEYTARATAWSPEVRAHLSWFTRATWQAAYDPHGLPVGVVEEARSRLPMLKAALKRVGQGERI